MLFSPSAVKSFKTLKCTQVPMKPFTLTNSNINNKQQFNLFKDKLQQYDNIIAKLH